MFRKFYNKDLKFRIYRRIGLSIADWSLLFDSFQLLILKKRTRKDNKMVLCVCKDTYNKKCCIYFILLVISSVVVDRTQKSRTIIIQTYYSYEIRKQMYAFMMLLLWSQYASNCFGILLIQFFFPCVLCVSSCFRL